ncbi:hypothetical protein F4561_005625 [Lipingzhangella halophila]|uniref:Uncharacterized protein n=1 Tax=Lipingzhangella halophila TaxID=1783352 RepID=A0A7W7RMK8_9ACTN|nr:hypothetical protein [Lipingzhangella halophila]MBB4934731.1 hypothetical protein [Lipingzhangella halophila]
MAGSWLLGSAAGAAAEEDTPGVLPAISGVSEVVGAADHGESAGGAAETTEAADPGAAAEEGAAEPVADIGRDAVGTPGPDSRDERTAAPVSETIQQTGTGTQRALNDVAHGAGETVSTTGAETAEPGRPTRQRDDAAQRGTGLVEPVTDAPRELVGTLRGQEQAGGDSGESAGPLPGPHVFEGGRTEAGSRTEGGTGAAEGGGPEGAGDRSQEAGSRHGTEDAELARSTAVLAAARDSGGRGEAGPGATTRSAPQVHDQGAGGSDPPATTSSSSSLPGPAAAAGYLMSRGDTVQAAAHRVALPDDPYVAVRDTTDDPSFSPD